MVENSPIVDAVKGFDYQTIIILVSMFMLLIKVKILTNTFWWINVSYISVVVLCGEESRFRKIIVL